MNRSFHVGLVACVLFAFAASPVTAAPKTFWLYNSTKKDAVFVLVRGIQSSHVTVKANTGVRVLAAADESDRAFIANDGAKEILFLEKKPTSVMGTGTFAVFLTEDAMGYYFIYYVGPDRLPGRGPDIPAAELERRQKATTDAPSGF